VAKLHLAEQLFKRLGLARCCPQIPDHKFVTVVAPMLRTLYRSAKAVPSFVVSRRRLMPILTAS
jgi:hypothetical protein